MNNQMKMNIAAIKSAAHLLIEILPMEMLDACLEFEREKREIEERYAKSKMNNTTKLQCRLHELKYKI